jgi:hypothetical protein
MPYGRRISSIKSASVIKGNTSGLSSEHKALLPMYQKLATIMNTINNNATNTSSILDSTTKRMDAAILTNDPELVRRSGFVGGSDNGENNINIVLSTNHGGIPVVAMSCSKTK